MPIQNCSAHYFYPTLPLSVPRLARDGGSQILKRSIVKMDLIFSNLGTFSKIAEKIEGKGPRHKHWLKKILALLPFFIPRSDNMDDLAGRKHGRKTGRRISHRNIGSPTEKSLIIYRIGRLFEDSATAHCLANYTPLEKSK